MGIRIFHTADLHLGMKFARGYSPEVQAALVDARFEALAGMVETANREQCSLFAVAGDMFDVVDLDDGRVAVSIGDVTGFGVGAGCVADHRGAPVTHGVALLAGRIGSLGQGREEIVVVPHRRQVALRFLLVLRGRRFGGDGPALSRLAPAGASPAAAAAARRRLLTQR